MTGPLTTLAISLYLASTVCGFVSLTYAMSAEFSRAAYQWREGHPDVVRAQRYRAVWRLAAWFVLLLAVGMTVAAVVAGEVGK